MTAAHGVRALACGLLLTLVAPLLVLVAAPAQACTCAPLSRVEQGAMADVVVSGRLERVEKQGSGAAGTLRMTAEVERVYAGDVDSRRVTFETPAASSACGLGVLPTGERYFFYLDAPDGAGGGEPVDTVLRATSCGGTGLATAGAQAQVVESLGDGEDVAVALRPQLTPVAEGDPPDPVGLATPGLVAVAVGVLGLLVLWPFRRRRR